MSNNPLNEIPTLINECIEHRITGIITIEKRCPIQYINNQITS